MARNDDFGVPFYTHQLSVNEDPRALSYFSNIEKYDNATQS
jgi:hypothetical protein